MLSITEGLSLSKFDGMLHRASNAPMVGPVERENRVNFYLKMRDIFGKFPEPSNKSISDEDIKSMENDLHNYKSSLGMSMQPMNSNTPNMQNSFSPIQQHQQLNNQQQEPEQNNELTMV